MVTNVLTIDDMEYDFSPDKIKILFFAIQQSLVDYPGKVSLILYTKGCNFCCNYCYNRKIMHDSKNVDFSYIAPLLSRIIRSSGVTSIVVSGGEPTIYGEELIKLLLYFKVNYPNVRLKLDTNGSNPEIIDKILRLNLIDYISMDIKNQESKYYRYGLNPREEYKILESVGKIKSSGIRHEFRTVLSPEITGEDKEAIKLMVPDVVFKDYKPNLN